MKFFSVIIYEDKWNIYLADDEDDVIADKDSNAEMDFSKREIYFRKGDLTIVDVRHEIFHVFIGYTFVRTAELEFGQMEEVSAEMFGERADRMKQLADDIFEKLKSMRDEEETQ